MDLVAPVPLFQLCLLI